MGLLTGDGSISCCDLYRVGLREPFGQLTIVGSSIQVRGIRLALVHNFCLRPHFVHWHISHERLVRSDDAESGQRAGMVDRTRNAACLLNRRLGMHHGQYI